MKQETKHIKYPDSDLSDVNELDDHTLNSTEFINKEIEGDETNVK